MSQNTNITLNEHLEGFIASQISHGHYDSASEVISASLRLLEKHEQKTNTLRQALIDGEDSGEYSIFDMNEIKQEARKSADLNA